MSTDPITFAGDVGTLAQYLLHFLSELFQDLSQLQEIWIAEGESGFSPTSS